MRHTPRRIAVLAAVIGALALAAPAGAITNGQPDDGEHPYVGQLFFYDADYVDSRFDDPGGWFNCSGTLIDDSIVLTAGHCTFGTGKDGASTLPGGWGGNDVWVSFDEVPDYEGINPTSSYDRDQNHQRYLDRVAWLAGKSSWHRGTSYPHPDYDNDAFYLADAGVVVLGDDMSALGKARLAGLDYLDRYTGKAKAQTLFEAVGYGLEKSLPIGAFGGDTRMKSQQVIVNSLGVYGVHDKSSIVFSNNKGKVHRGGTCSGDSGGPFFLNNTNLQVAVNSYGVPPNCTGGDGGYRIDQPDDVAWLQMVLAGEDPRFEG
jgi:hypothetical protein